MSPSGYVVLTQRANVGIQARLAQYVAQIRALLVLDGVEPLQYSPGPVGGRLKDPALEALLKGLAQQNPGLCIATTREPVENLAPFRDTTSPQWGLEHLSVEAGADLLFRIGVTRAGNAQIRAGDKELKDAAREVGGHALTLQLLGRYIAKAHNGDVRKRNLVRFAKADAKIQGGHAFKVMGAYEKWLAEGDGDALLQLAVLRLLGLFDRPADAGCLAALREEPAIVGLTEPLVSLSDDDWNCTLSNLVECGLVSRIEDQFQIPNGQFEIDCHPLIREYFARRLSEGNPDAWRTAHRRLYEYLRDSTPDLPQPPLDDLQPLYQAVAHACQARLYRAGLALYRRRVKRGNEHFSTFTLGAFGQNLAALSWFFAQPYEDIVEPLGKMQKAYVMKDAAFQLRALGRSEEAKALIEEAWNELAILGTMSAKKRASIGGIYSNTLKLMGELGRAVDIVNESVELANSSGNVRTKVRLHASLGDILHCSGKSSEAHAAFEEAEKLSVSETGQRLSGNEGFKYWQFLLDQNELNEVWTRSEEAFRTGPLMEHRALALCCLGDAYSEVRLPQCQKVPQSAIECLDWAVELLRAVCGKDLLPFALMSRARLRHHDPDVAGRSDDLDEAWEIAERGSMKLHMADIHLHRGRLFHDKNALAEARKLIEQCGYHRRDEELADAEEAAKNW